MSDAQVDIDDRKNGRADDDEDDAHNDGFGSALANRQRAIAAGHALLAAGKRDKAAQQLKQLTGKMDSARKAVEEADAFMRQLKLLIAGVVALFVVPMLIFEMPCL